MKRIIIGICDDKLEVLRGLERLLLDICVELGVDSEIHLFLDGQKLLENISSFQIVFLDIEMPGVDGIELGKQIRKLNPECKIVMATGRVERFKEAFQIQALRFVTKPFEKGEVKEAMEVAIGFLHFLQVVEVYYQRSKYSISEEDIRYIKAYDGYSEVYVGNKVYRKNCSLDEFEKLLSKWLFVRINREVIINLFWIEQERKGTVQMQTEAFRVSRRRKKEFEHKNIEFDLKYRKGFS